MVIESFLSSDGAREKNLLYAGEFPDKAKLQKSLPSL
jgi:hypothetical protein